MAVRQQCELFATGQAAPVRAAWPRPSLLCFLLGLLGAVPLVVLTPPFQVPDENLHFLRAYQLSELQLTAIMQEGEARVELPASLEARAMRPSSLIELVETFLGTRAVYHARPISEQPLRRTLMALDRPLDPGRRELVIVPATKAPPSYAPQASRSLREDGWERGLWHFFIWVGWRTHWWR
jgi:hypothetical protein